MKRMLYGLFRSTRPLLSPKSSKKPDVVRLLYGKRRNAPHQHSLGKPGVTALLAQMEVSSGTSAPNSFVQGLQRAFTVGELGREEALQLLRKHRKLKRLDRSRALWEWCTSPIESVSPSGDRRRTMPAQAAIWTAAHDAAFLAHINDTGDPARAGTRSRSPARHSDAEPASASAALPSSYSLAVSVYRRAIEAGRGNHRALMGGLLNSYARRDDWCGALKAYTQHIVMDQKPTDSYHLHTVMNVCRRCGVHDQGIKLFQIAVGTGEEDVSVGRDETAATRSGNEKDPNRNKNTNNNVGSVSKKREVTTSSSSSTPSSSSPSTPSRRHALVPRPNAVVYLELLRLFAQSNWPGKHRHALSILQALHANNTRHVPTAEGERESKNLEPPIELTAGHYNAVLMAMKPTRPYPLEDTRFSRGLSTTSTAGLPPPVIAGRRLYEQMKQRGVQPNAETLAALLSLHPRHVSHVLFCVSECHLLGLPVTADMYRAVLTTLMMRTYSSPTTTMGDTTIALRTTAPIQPSTLEDSHWHGVEPTYTNTRHNSAFALDVVRFIEAEYKRYESFDDPAIPPATPPSTSRTGGNDDEAAQRQVGSYHSPDMIGLHLTTALVDVLLSHPSPAQAQQWITLFAPRIRPLLAALTAGASDRLGLEPSEMFPAGSGSAAAMGAQLHNPAPSSSFLWQVHGRVAVVDHNVVLSPLFESLAFHYDAVIVPFSVLRVLVRRLTELRPSSKKGRHTRRALRRLREKAQQQDVEKQLHGKDNWIVRVLPLAHQLYAHRYLEGSLWWREQGSETESEEDATSRLPGKLTPPANSTTSPRNAQSSQSAGASTPEDTRRLPLLTRTATSLSPSEKLLKALMNEKVDQTDVEQIPSRDMEARNKQGTVVKGETTPPHYIISMEREEGERAERHINVSKPFSLYRPNITVTMPERVLAVACMLKTLNPEASVHVLSSSSASGKHCPLKQAVTRWNSHQQEQEQQQSSSESMMLTLTHVFHPTELSIKAPSELQLPPVSR